MQIGTPECFCQRNHPKWPRVNMPSQISAILGSLESHILRRKRKIYESVTSSIQNDLKPCYEGGPQGGTSTSWVSGTLHFLLASCSACFFVRIHLSNQLLVTLSTYMLKQLPGHRNRGMLFIYLSPEPLGCSLGRSFSAPFLNAQGSTLRLFLS